MPPDIAVWQGRVDSTDNYDAFRWHQVVRALNLNNGEPAAFGGELGFGLLGFCCDEGIRRNQGRVGASKGPEAIRRELANLPCSFSPEVALFDAGNVWCLDGDLEKSQDSLACAVAGLRRMGLFPVVLGGGHELALGHYRGQWDYLAGAQESPDLGIVNFDAHFDLRPLFNGSSSGTMFRQIAEEMSSRNREFKYLCIGIQESSNTLELFKTARSLDAGHILARDIISREEGQIIKKIDDFIDGTERLYVTVCTDVFSSAFAPGVSSPQALGMNPEDVLKYIKHVLRSNKVVGFDIAEVSPRFDHDNSTASLAKVLIYAVVNTICSLKGMSRQQVDSF